MLFEEYLKGQLFYILKPYETFEESLRKGKLVKKLEIFSMNNKTIIEFGFRIMWRSMQISEGVIIHLGLQPPSIIAKYWPFSPRP